MTIPDTTNVVPSAPSRGPKILALTWMILAQFLSILVILAALAFGWFAGYIGSGLVVGGEGSYLEYGLFLSPIFLIPIIGSWIAYKKSKVAFALILTTLTFVLLACPCAFFMLLIALSS